MAKRAGRNMLLKVGTDPVGGVRALSFKLDATPIDITDADANGLITYLSGEAATKQITLEVSGLADTNLLRSKAMDPTTDMLLTNLSFTDPGAVIGSDVLTGDFFMTNYSESGTHDGATEFSATFTSSGAWVAA